MEYKKAFLYGCLSWVCLLSHSVQAEELKSKNVYVIDGDTIAINYKKIRLWGLHAPELDQQAGQSAKSWLQAYLKNQEVICYLSDQKTYDRHIGMCFRGKQDVAAAVIQAGYGRDCTYYSRGLYAAFESSKSREITLPRYCL